MKVLILDTYYQSFINATYAAWPDLARLPYTEQWRGLMDQCFATADFYSSNLQPLGVEATEIVVNADHLQARWAKENAPALSAVGWSSKVPKVRNRWRAAIAKAQIRHFRPDVLYVQDAAWPSDALLEWAKANTRLVVAQHATALRTPELLHRYDLVVSTIPKVVAACRQVGIASEHLRLGFGQQVLERIESPPLEHDLVHVGSYGPIHRERNQLLEQLAKSVPGMSFWGSGIEHLPSDSAIRRNYAGPAWGLDMYRVRAASRMTITKHITSVVGEDAANQTLYETTGIGSCLVVDNKKNLGDLFEKGREVVAYDDANDAAEKIAYLLEHEDERARIAAAGQRRTLRDHTYGHRMRELQHILHRYI